MRLFDTATRSLREFVPLRPAAASIYVCGATVQGVPHIGHVRSALDYDVLRRWLAATGHDVLLVRNVTDIDDKILTKAAGAGRPGGSGPLSTSGPSRMPTSGSAACRPRRCPAPPATCRRWSS